MACSYFLRLKTSFLSEILRYSVVFGTSLFLASIYVLLDLGKEGIQLQRARSWCVSTDKEFSAKSADIIGLYLNPPNNA